MKRKHLFHSFVFLMTGLVTLAFGHVAQADNTTTAESSTSETFQYFIIIGEKCCIRQDCKLEKMKKMRISNILCYKT